MASMSLCSSASAQSTGRFVSGPLVWSPTFQLREAGVDSNVFNTPTDPKEDFIATGAALVNSVLTLGVLQATTAGGVDYLYFDRYKSQRGLNGRVNSHFEFPVTRFSPDVTVAWTHSKDRGGNEVDTRVPHTDLSYALGIQTRATSQIAITVTAGKQRQTYERGFTFRDVEIAQQLDRESLLANVSGQVTLTPLTSLAIDAGYSRDSFPFRPLAATDNIRVGATFDFAPDAVIAGRASIGYRSMKPQHGGASSSEASSFSGLTSATELSYRLLDVTRFTGRFSRDANYSISTTQSTYLSTAGGLDIVQTLFGPVDVTIRAARERLQYSKTDMAPGHSDFADSLGGGVSIRVAPDTVVAVLYDNTQRRSKAGHDFEYNRRRIYATISYGY